jgi:uncharacterized repeat protein (TIGR01451 family)
MYRKGFWLVLALIMLMTTVGAPVPQATAGGPSAWEVLLSERSVRIWRSPWYPTDHELFVTTETELRRTTDAGDTWEVLYPTEATLPLSDTERIGAMAFDPFRPESETLFVARDDAAGAAQIDRSLDDGATWQTVFTTTAGVVHDMTAVRNAANRLVVFAVGDGGHIWRSLDGGESWATAESCLPSGMTEVTRIFASPAFATDETLYAIGGAVGESFFVRSTDGGDCWREVDIPHVSTVHEVVFSPRYADDGTLWLSYAYAGDPGEFPFNGVMRSTDFGATWEDVSEGLDTSFYDGRVFGLAVSPSPDPSLYAVQLTAYGPEARLDLYRRSGPAEQWRNQGPVPSAAVGTLLVAERDLLFLAGSDGLWRLENRCWEHIINGDCERNAGWELIRTRATAAYTTAQAHGGERAIHIGIVGGYDRYAYSSARQSVTIPSEAVTTTLTLWLYPVSTEAQMAAPAPVLHQAQLGTSDVSPTAPAAGDAQYVLLMNEAGTIVERLLWMLNGDATWSPHTFDLSAYAGETVWLHVGVYNDGHGGTTGLYLDDVSLTACEPEPPLHRPPASEIDALDTVQSTTSFPVSWHGTDRGWGVRGYDVQVREGDAEQPWTDWLTGTVASSAVFTGEVGRTYTFRTRAWDAYGAMEPWPPNAWQDKHTTVLLEPAPVLVTSDKVAQPLTVRKGDVMEFQIHLKNTGNLNATVQVTDPLPSTLRLTNVPWSNQPPDPVVVDDTITWSGTVETSDSVWVGGVAIGFEAEVLTVPTSGVVTNAFWVDDGVSPPLRRQITVTGLFAEWYLPLVMRALGE